MLLQSSSRTPSCRRDEEQVSAREGRTRYFLGGPRARVGDEASRWEAHIDSITCCEDVLRRRVGVGHVRRDLLPTSVEKS